MITRSSSRYDPHLDSLSQWNGYFLEHHHQYYRQGLIMTISDVFTLFSICRFHSACICHHYSNDLLFPTLSLIPDDLELFSQIKCFLPLLYAFFRKPKYQILECFHLKECRQKITKGKNRGLSLWHRELPTSFWSIKTVFTTIQRREGK